jgi:outer membrane protein assembly factor BamA
LRTLGIRFAVIVWFFALPAVAAHPAKAQQLQPESYTGFDGQPVSKVDIAASLGVNLSQMRQLIQQKAGQPFSSDAVRASVAALQETRLFTEVQLSMEPDQSGLHLTFILQPADYVGVLQFPGLGARFPYASLLQAANIPEQSPYIPGLETQATQGVLSFLHTRGFYSAEVTPELQRDQPHHVVNIIFRCTLESRARIGNIEFTGVSDERAVQVRAALKSWWARLKLVSLKPGQKYSQPRVTKSVPYIRDHLKVAGQLAPSIRLGTPKYDADTNRVDVTFEVTAGSKVSVRVEGAKISQKNIRKLVPIYQENSVDIELVDEGEANVNAYFQSKGYFDAATSSSMTKNDGEVDVVYTVKRGSKHRLKSVNFDGNQRFSDKQLAAKVFVSKAFPVFGRGKYSEQLLNKSVTSLTQFYKDAGYANVSINPKVEDFEPQVFVTFQIKEGSPDQVASLKLQGNATQTLTALTSKYPLPMQTGQAYSAKLLDQDRNQLLAAYLDFGYLNANVESSASPIPNDPHKLDVTFTVDEGPRAYVSNVVMLGQQHTKPQLIQLVAGGLVQKGQPQSQRNFLQAESNLYDLGVFDWASVMPLRPIVDQTQEEVLEKVHESPLNSMDIGGGVEIIPRDGNIPVNSVAVPGLPPISIGNKFQVSQKSYVGPSFTFDFVRHNIRGRAETATIGTIVSRLDQKAFFTYADPHLHASSWSSLFSISGERTTENPIYTAELFDASFQVDKPLDAKRTKRLIGRYSFDRTNLYNILIPNLVLPQDQHVRLSTFDAEYVRDTRDKPLDAHHGVYQTFDAGITSTALGASANFVRFLGQSAFYIPMKPWLIWANNFRFGFAIPYSSSYVPINERFFSGGADSLRGFPINGAGPQRPLPVCTNPSDPSTCTLISVPVGGDMLFIVNSEARFPLPVDHSLGGVFFYDGGNVYSSIRLSQFTGNFTNSVGFGLRYDTPVGPIRFDFGYRITNEPGIKATQYFVTLGQSF